MPSTLTQETPPPPERTTSLRSAKAHRPNVLSLMIGGVRGRHWTFKFGAGAAGGDRADPAARRRGSHRTTRPPRTWPTGWPGPSAEHWFGTDHLGRDVLSRLMWGGRFSVTIAAITLVICAVTGAHHRRPGRPRGGWLDELVMRTVDVLICFPDVVIALFLIALFGTGYGTLIAALTITGWTPFARLMRGLALEINSKDYVEAAEILGSPKSYIVFRHVIPNAMRPVLAMSFLRFGHKLITVGALSYLGLGVQPPDSDWGAMLLDAQPYMERAPGLGILPGAAIFLTALSVTMIGQGLDLKKRQTQARRHPRTAHPAP